MKPNISEFSYGFAVTHELLINGNWPDIVAAPVFPSLYEEGQSGGGYDLMMDFGFAILFVQFKLCDYMTRATADECRRGLLSCPFYRMHLRPLRHSSQHQSLLKLDEDGEIVYYVAPMFHEPEQLDEHFQNQDVSTHSVWLRPLSIGDLDEEEHHVSFAHQGPIYVCSEPKEIAEPTTFEAFLGRLHKRMSEKSRPGLTKERVNTLADKVADIGRKTSLFPDSETDSTKAHPLQRLATNARKYLDSQVYVVGYDLPPIWPMLYLPWNHSSK